MEMTDSELMEYMSDFEVLSALNDYESTQHHQVYA